MLESYGPIALFFIVASIFPLVALVLARFIAPRRPDRVKLSPYESGVETIGPTHIQFRTRYYLYALIFVIFDVEAIYLFPWAVALDQLGLFGLIEMAIFIALVFVAYVYIWKKGGLEWAGSSLTPIETETEIRRDIDVPARASEAREEAAGAR